MERWRLLDGDGMAGLLELLRKPPWGKTRVQKGSKTTTTDRPVNSTVGRITFGALSPFPGARYLITWKHGWGGEIGAKTGGTVEKLKMFATHGRSRFHASRGLLLKMIHHFTENYSRKNAPLGKGSKIAFATLISGPVQTKEDKRERAVIKRVTHAPSQEVCRVQCRLLPLFQQTIDYSPYGVHFFTT